MQIGKFFPTTRNQNDIAHMVLINTSVEYLGAESKILQRGFLNLIHVTDILY